MKLCPKCKAELDDNARFCLRCMTSLEEKEQIPPPVHPIRRWPLVLILFLLLGILLVFIYLITTVPEETASPTQSGVTATPSGITQTPSQLTHTVDGVTYTFRPATKEDHPTAITLDNYFVLIRVEGIPTDGIYRVPSFIGDDYSKLVKVVADSAFAGTDARRIDLGHNVRFVWGDAFGGCPLKDLYLHTDVLIAQETLSGCDEDLTIHCPDFLENTEGTLWSDLAADYGFQWQPLDL